jgi:hypothetical protein
MIDSNKIAEIKTLLDKLEHTGPDSKHGGQSYGPFFIKLWN